MLRVGFTGFWRGFNCTHNFFLECLTKGLHPITIGVQGQGEGLKPDLYIRSVFSPTVIPPDVPHITYIGEAIDPLTDEFALSFSSTFKYNKSIYFPLWIMLFNWFDTDSTELLPLSQYQRLCGYRHGLKFEDRLDRCAILIGNMTSERQKRIEALQRVIPCDLYGRAYSRPIPDGYNNKLDLLRRYRFHYCDENTAMPGYVTEKLAHAALAGCIPIYNSTNIFGLKIINRSCFIDSSELNTMIALVKIARESQSVAAHLLSEPLFLAKTNTEVIQRSVLSAVGSTLSGINRIKQCF